MIIDEIENWNKIKLDILYLGDDNKNELYYEDMFQINKSNYTIDSGWYFAQKSFVTYLLFNNNWDNPMGKITSKSLSSCIDAICLLVKYVDKIIESEKE